MPPYFGAEFAVAVIHFSTTFYRCIMTPSRAVRGNNVCARIYKLLPLFIFVLALASCKDDPVSSPLPVELPDPIITSIAPDSAYIDDDIIITGEHFSAVTSANVVTFAGGVQGMVISASSTTLVVRVPDGADSGVITVAVGDKLVQSSHAFVRLAGGEMMVSTLYPSSRKVAVGDSLVAHVSNLPADVSRVVVRIGGIPARIIGHNETQLIIQVPDIPNGVTTAVLSVEARGVKAEDRFSLAILRPILRFKNCVLEVTGVRVQVQSTRIETRHDGTQDTSSSVVWRDFNLAIDTRGYQELLTRYSVEKGFDDNTYILRYERLFEWQPIKRTIDIVCDPVDYRIRSLSASEVITTIQDGGHNRVSTTEAKTMILGDLQLIGNSAFEYELSGGVITPFIQSMLVYSLYNGSFPSSGTNTSVRETVIGYDCPATAKITVKFFD